MARKSLGIEIGDRNLKIVECNGRKIVHMAVAQILPDAVVQNGRIMAYNAVGALIRETMKENRIRTKTADIVLPTESYFIKRVQMPKMTAKQLKVNLPYEFHDFISDDMSHYVYDYAVLGINEDTMDLMIAACSKQLVTNYVTLCRQAGLKLNKLVPDVLALEAIVMPKEDAAKRQAGKSKEEKAEQERKRKEARIAARNEKKRSSKKNRAVEEELEKLGTSADGNAAQGSGSLEGGVPEGTAVGGAASVFGAAVSSSVTGGEAQGYSVSGQYRPDGNGVSSAGISGSGRTGAQAPASAGSGASGTSAGPKSLAEIAEEEGLPKQDYAVLDFGHTGTRLHFFSKGAYEITRTMNTSARMVADQLAEERSIDVHIAELMLANNQDNVLDEPLIADAYDTMATEIQRVMNFYSYSNPGNTIEKIYYFGDGLNVERMKSRITEAIGLELVPLTDLIPEAEGAPELQLAPQAYGCVLE